jgi:tRNA-dihydrouridine synthase A
MRLRRRRGCLALGGFLRHLGRMTRAYSTAPAPLSRRFCVAPMMEWTDRHCRYFHRLLTRRALLYTEMLTTGAVLRGDRARLLAFDPFEHPVALQLGGSEPGALAAAARIAEDFGYDEINLNVGCPSDRVQDGRFGACLMAEPALVGDSVAAMKRAVRVPVTVKCRLGIDDQDPEIALEEMAATVRSAGADALIVHARKAWLAGLSPRENREVPPLDHARVYRLKRAHPPFEVVINGGVDSIETARRHLAHVDGVMMGRAAYGEPWRLLAVDPLLFDAPAPFASAKEAVEAFLPYVERELERGTRLYAMVRHVLGVFRAVPGARAFRRHLASEGVRAGAGTDVVRTALDKVVDTSAADLKFLHHLPQSHSGTSNRKAALDSYTY